MLQTLTPETESINMRLTEVEHKTQRLAARLDDQESRARHNNVCIIDLPEKVKEASMVHYLEDWLQQVIAPEGLTKFYALERAHRVHTTQSRPGAQPRPVVAQLLHYRDRDYILQQARERVPTW